MRQQEAVEAGVLPPCPAETRVFLPKDRLLLTQRVTEC
jgi:hypothetical protein